MTRRRRSACEEAELLRLYRLLSAEDRRLVLGLVEMGSGDRRTICRDAKVPRCRHARGGGRPGRGRLEG